ncbi:hypothetical protein GYMLUDRAFT_39082 [Collybiopsis luxurians FD-317 M1]|nr:hypothetical protein GYMLUDRAFT_39082 [Collybiopsis luxurians FD-317 M1]
MSRHRYVKNLNIADELDDDALSDGGYDEEMTADQLLQMNDVLEEIRKIIGEEDISGLQDSEIKDTIWNCYFSFEESLEWCLDQQEKRRAAKERQALPPQDDHHYTGMHKYGPNSNDFGIGGRSRMPLIHLAQQQQQMMEQRQRQMEWEQQRQQAFQEPPQEIVIEEARQEDMDFVDMEDAISESSRRLSTISERTERTELSPYWPRNDYLPPPRTISTFTDSSYGNLIDAGHLKNPASLPLDPNLIPVSPSGSALHRLSTYDPAPSKASSISYPSTPPNPPSEPVPPIDTIPDIPDSQSSAVPPPPPPPPKSPSPVKTPSSSAPTQQAVKQSTKQSKLAQLASSRASTRTKSSASLGVEAEGSIKTYPVLRPESHWPLSSASSSTSSSTALPVPPPGQPPVSIESLTSTASTASPTSSPSKTADRPRDTVASNSLSSTSLDVRKAVQAALELEAIDRELAASRQARRTPSEKKPPTVSSKPGTPSRPAAPTPSKVAQELPSTTSSSPSRPAAPTPSSKVAPEVPSNVSTTSQSTRPPSKLALLAQAKAQKAEAQKAVSKAPRAKPPPSNHLPPEHTEYLTPIANGSSVTTAITTSYQTLYSLTDPTRSVSTDAPFVVPLPAPQYIKGPTNVINSPPSTPTKPPSKLAMKVKKAQEEKSSTHSLTTYSAEEEDVPVVIVPPIFLPRADRSSASPSAFASILVDDDLIHSPEVNDGTATARRKSTKGKEKATSTGSVGTASASEGKPSTRYSHRKRIVPTIGTPTTASSFAFDGPSPDDIVFNARRGTSLAVQNKDRKEASSSAARRSTSSKA